MERIFFISLVHWFSLYNEINVQIFAFADPPKVFVTPEEVSLNETDDIVLNCTATGIPQPRYTCTQALSWCFVGSHFFSSAHTRGPQLCRVMLILLLSLSLSLSLSRSLLFTHSPSLCVSFSFIRVYWNVTSLRSNYSSETLKSVVTRPEGDEVAVTQLLNLKNITGADNGYVKCIAENIVGKSEDSASLLKINCKLLEVLSFILSHCAWQREDWSSHSHQDTIHFLLWFAYRTCSFVKLYSSGAIISSRRVYNERERERARDEKKMNESTKAHWPNTIISPLLSSHYHYHF